MRLPTRFAAILLAVTPFAASGWTASADSVLPEPRASYSATQTMTVGGQAMTARIFNDQGRERREMTMEGMDSVMLLLPDEGVSYVIQPQLGMAMRMPLEESDSGPDPSGLKDMDAVAEGKDGVAGLDTTRYRVSATEGGGGFAGLVWATEDGIYAKMEGTATEGADSVPIAMELSDVRRGPQDPSLFQVPAGVRVMDMGPIAGRTPEILKR